MSLGHSPSVVTNGLVLYYDINNQTKSYIGEPTTNLLYAADNTLASAWVWINSGTYTGSVVTDVAPPEYPTKHLMPSTLRVISGEATSALSSVHYGCALTTISPSTTYTISVWFRQNRAGATQPYMRSVVTNINIGTCYYNGVAGSANWPVNEWIRIYCTGTTAANETGIFLSNYLGANIGDKVWYYGAQVEQKSNMTSLVAGTRSNTQTLLDLTGTNTITATSLTYATDNTFSFNGLGNYITLPSDLGYTTEVSVFAWVKTSGTPRGGYHIITGSQGAELSIPAGGQVRTGVFTNTRFVSNHGSGLADGLWHYIGFTYAGTNKESYIDGASVGSYAITGTLSYAVTGRAVGIFGAGDGTYGMNGTIGSLSFYSKALTAAEVRQNFNAHRERYGL